MWPSEAAWREWPITGLISFALGFCLVIDRRVLHDLHPAQVECSSWTKSGFLKPRRSAIGLLFLLAGLILAAIHFSPKSPKEEPLRFIGLTNDLILGRIGIFRYRLPRTAGFLVQEWSDKIEKITMLNDGIWRTNEVYWVPPNSRTVTNIPGSHVKEMELRIAVPLKAEFHIQVRRNIQVGVFLPKKLLTMVRLPWTKTEYFGCDVVIKPD